MSSATVAALNAIMRMDSSSFMAGTTSAQGALRKLSDESDKTSKSMAQMGDSLTKKVSLPLLGVGAAATAMSMDYEKSFAQMQGLAGVSAADVTKFKGAVESLGPATAIGPNELAKGLYFVASAGYKGDEALKVLDASARAAGAGLGDTATIADLVTSAMSAYAKSGLTAADATDILTMAVRDGKAEPEEMAEALGKVIPVASSMGVSFDQVAAATAAMTNSGLDTGEATTALRGMMTQIMQGGAQAEAALAGMGSSTAELRKMIAEQGLLPALQFLAQGFEGNSAAAIQLFGDVRGLTGFLNLMGQDTEKVTGIFYDTAHATGATSEALNVMSQTAGFKAKAALADLEKSGIKVGDILLPRLASGAEKASSALEGFSNAPPQFQQLAVNIGMAAVAAGPLMSILGRMKPLGDKVASAMVGVGSSFKGTNMATFGMDAEKAAAANEKLAGRSDKLKSAAAGAGGAIAATFVVYEAWTSMMDAAAASGQKLVSDALGPMHEKMAAGKVTVADLEGHIGRMNDAIAANGTEVQNSSAIWDADYRNALMGANTEMQKNTASEQAMVEMSKQMAAATGHSADEYVGFVSKMAASGTTYKTAQDALDAYNQAQLSNMGVTDVHGQKVEDLKGQYADTAVQIEQARAKLKEWEDAVNAQFDPLFGMMDALTGTQEANQRVTEATTALTTAQREHGYTSIEAQKATIDLQTAQDGLLKSNVELDTAAAKLTAGVKDGSVSMDTFRSTVDSWAASGRISAQQAETLKKRIFDTGVQADSVSGKSYLINFFANTSAVDTAVAHVQALMASLPQTYGNLVGVSAGAEKFGGMFANAVQPHASGGALNNGWFSVGEDGPELGFKSGSSVQIFSNAESKSMMGGPGGGGVHIGNFTYQAAPGESTSDRRRNAREIVEMIRDYERENQQ